MKRSTQHQTTINFFTSMLANMRHPIQSISHHQAASKFDSIRFSTRRPANPYLRVVQEGFRSKQEALSPAQAGPRIADLDQREEAALQLVQPAPASSNPQRNLLVLS